MMKKSVLMILLVVFLLVLGACGKTDNISEAYGKYEYTNADSSKASIIVNKEEVQFKNVNMNELKEIKVAFEVQKEITRLEREGTTVDEQKKEEIRQNINQGIDWSSFSNTKFDYAAEYEEDTQTVYFESVTGNQNELFFSYDLKYQTLTIYNIEFVKNSN